jgi:hypothetical protein
MRVSPEKEEAALPDSLDTPVAVLPSNMFDETNGMGYSPTGAGVERPLNVLVLGEMANGKSTMIRQLNIYAGNPNPDVGIGYGKPMTP